MYFESDLSVVGRINDIHKAYQYNWEYLRMTDTKRHNVIVQIIYGNCVKKANFHEGTRLEISIDFHNFPPHENYG